MADCLADLLMLSVAIWPSTPVYADEDTLIVKPVCPVPPQSVPCLTLTEFAHAVDYHSANTTLELLPGQHSLDHNIEIFNVTSFTMLRSELWLWTCCFCSVPWHYYTTGKCMLQSMEVGCMSVAGGVYLYRTSLHCNGMINTAQQKGGGTDSLDSVIVFNGYIRYVVNTAFFGGGLYAQGGSMLCDRTLVFDSNRADQGGGVSYSVSISGRTLFTNNSASCGGGMYIQNYYGS